MSTKLGNIMLISSIAAMFLVTISMLQNRTYELWTAAFSATNYIPEPQPWIVLNWSEGVSKGVTIAALAMSAYAISSLVGKRRLLGLSATWIMILVTSSQYSYLASAPSYFPGRFPLIFFASAALIAAFLPLEWSSDGKLVYTKRLVSGSSSPE